MIGNFLRQVSKGQLVWSKCAKRWQQQGAEVVHGIPPAMVTPLRVCADSGWEAIIDLAAWFEFMMPAQAGLATCAFSRTQLETLFFGCERPVDLALAEFDYQYLTPVALPEPVWIEQAHYGLRTAYGVVWITAYGDNNNNSSFFSENFPLDYLPIPLHFELGSSQCRLSVINKLRCGDVLLITELIQRVTLHGKCVGFYQRAGDEIMIEEGFLQPPFADETQIDGEEMDDSGDYVSPRSQIPVKLTFTLQQAMVTVQDLEALCQGHVFFCDPDAEKKVVIKGNGLPLAMGELIWLDDRLGVEVTALYNEAGNGE